MQNRGIDASLSTQSLTFQPGGPPVSFEVTVVNVSGQFAAFQLEVLAAGASRSPGARWYGLSPEVSAAKPHGSTTDFKIDIFDTPLPAFVGTVILTVRIFSPELREERRLIVRLTIEPGAGGNWLQVELPVQQFQVYPRNLVDIPVQVRNSSPRPADVVLTFTGLNPGWLVNSTERRLIVDPGSIAETTFQCQPPVVTQAPSQIYPFTIEALSQDGSAGSADGSLEVLPVGFVEFSTNPAQQKIPAQGGWLPDWKSNSASFELLFKNASNLRQQLNVQVQGQDHRQCKCRVVPENANLNLGKTTKVVLETSIKRPWVGLAKTLRLEVKTLLSDQRLGTTDPATQPLELRILPVVPLWLLLAVLAALLALLLRPEPAAHTAAVNVVNFSEQNGVVLSGSSDCTIRRWTIAGDRLQPEGQLEKEQLEDDKASQQTCKDMRHVPKGLLAVTDQAVWSLKFFPGESNLVAAGLGNGEIQLLNVDTGKPQYKALSDPKAAGYTDRVSDITLTHNSLYLFSGHDSGQVRIWQRSGINNNFQLAGSLNTSGQKYVIRALALSQDENTLISAGGFKRLIVWNHSRWDQTQPKRRPWRLLSDQLGNQTQSDEILAIAFRPNFPNQFATADTDGFITIWDLNQCSSSEAASTDSQLEPFSASSDPTPSQSVEPVNYKCQVYHWQASASNKAVRSLDFSQDGRQLVSAGNEGTIVLWTLTSEGKLDRKATPKDGKVYTSPEGFQAQQIYSSNQNRVLNSIKLIADHRVKAIVSGGQDREDGYFQVKLHPIPSPS